MLHIICALKPEARPLLDHFELRALPDAPGIFHNAAAQLSLTRSGIGQSAAVSAVTRTHAYFNADKSHAWLNPGVAGHASLPVGQAVMVNKVTDAASGQVWFPSRVFPVTLPTCELSTRDAPGSDYGQELFDMEGAGFFRAVSALTTLELAQTLKIVSDNAAEPVDNVTPALITRLLQQNLPVIEKVVEQLLSLSKLLQDLNDPGPDYQAIIGRWHFSVSQQHQLRELLRRWRALRRDDTRLTEHLAQCPGKQQRAATILQFLRDELDKTDICLD